MGGPGSAGRWQCRSPRPAGGAAVPGWSCWCLGSGRLRTALFQKVPCESGAKGGPPGVETAWGHFVLASAAPLSALSDGHSSLRRHTLPRPVCPRDSPAMEQAVAARPRARAGHVQGAVQGPPGAPFLALRLPCPSSKVALPQAPRRGPHADFAALAQLCDVSRGATLIKHSQNSASRDVSTPLRWFQWR